MPNDKSDVSPSRYYAAICSHGIPPNSKLVLLALMTHADWNTGACYPSVGRLATMTGLSRRTVQRALTGLQEYGLMVVTKQGGGNQPNTYRVDLEKMLTRVTGAQVPVSQVRGRGVTVTREGCHTDTGTRVTGAHKLLHTTSSLNSINELKGEPPQQAGKSTDESKPATDWRVVAIDTFGQPAWVDGFRPDPEQVKAIVRAYPNKSGQIHARRAVESALEHLTASGCPDSAQWLKRRVEAFSGSWRARDIQYVPAMAKWLRDGCYLDPDSAWADPEKAKKKRAAKEMAEQADRDAAAWFAKQNGSVVQKGTYPCE